MPNLRQAIVWHRQREHRTQWARPEIPAFINRAASYRKQVTHLHTALIAGPERAPFNEIVARYLEGGGDPRKVVKDPGARYFGGRLEEKSLAPLGEARLGQLNLEEWLRRSQKRA